MVVSECVPAMAFDLADEPVPEFDPAWRTAAVVGLAKAIADGRHDVFPILADALADAGCNDPRILNHCRDCESHRDDCWVLDGLQFDLSIKEHAAVRESISQILQSRRFPSAPVTDRMPQYFEVAIAFIGMLFVLAAVVEWLLKRA